MQIDMHYYGVYAMARLAGLVKMGDGHKYITNLTRCKKCGTRLSN